MAEHACPYCPRTFVNRGPLTMHVRAHEKRGDVISGGARVPPPDAPPAVGADGAAPPDSQYSPHEEVPGGAGPVGGPPPRVGLVDRVRARVRREPAAPRPARRRLELLGPVKGPRRPLTGALEGVIDWTGRRLERVGTRYWTEGNYDEAPFYASVPMARSLSLVAPAAARMADKALEGSIVDRIAQPFVARGEALGEVYKILSLPVLMRVAEDANPMILRVTMTEGPDGSGLKVEGALKEDLYDAMEAVLLADAEVVADKQKKREKGRKRIAEAFPELVAQGVDPVMQQIAQLLRPPDAPTAPGPGPEVAHPAAV